MHSLKSLKLFSFSYNFILFSWKCYKVFCMSGGSRLCRSDTTLFGQTTVCVCELIKLNNPKYIIYKIKDMQDRKNQPHINKPNIWENFFNIRLGRT